MFRFLVIISFISLASTRVTNNTREQKVHDLFNSMDRKTVPLYYCRSWTNGILWRMPKPLECPILHIDKPSQVIQITIWWQDITMHTIEAYECYKTIQYSRKSIFFFGAYSQEDHTTKIAVTESDCREMIRRQMTPDNRQLQRKQEGFFITDEKIETTWNWPKTDEQTVTNYFMVNLKISINNI